MVDITSSCDGWQEVIAPLRGLVDLDASARACGALVRRREIRSGEELLRLIMAWGPGGLSLRQAAAWAGASGIADLCDSALLLRIRQAADWLETLVSTVLEARAPMAARLASQGRLLRLVDGSTLSVAGASRPGWRLHAGFDLPSGQMGQMLVTPAQQGENLALVPVTKGELRIADRGFAKPDGLKFMLDHEGDFLVRLGSRSLRLSDGDGAVLDLPAILAQAAAQGGYDGDVRVLHGRKGPQAWTPLAARLVIKPLPPEKAEAARKRVARAGQREGYEPSQATVTAASFVMLLTSLDRRQMPDADDIFALYRLRWQVELAFKRLKSLEGLRSVPLKREDSTRAWIAAHLLLFLITEDFGADFGDSPP